MADDVIEHPEGRGNIRNGHMLKLKIGNPDLFQVGNSRVNLDSGIIDTNAVAFGKSGCNGDNTVAEPATNFKDVCVSGIRSV